MTANNNIRDLEFTIRTDEAGDYIHFFDGRDKVRGDKSIIRFLYDRCAEAQALQNKAVEVARLEASKILLAGAGGRIDVPRSTLVSLPKHGYSIVNWTEPTTDAEVYELRIEPELQGGKDE